MRQFRLANIRPSASGQYITATVVDPDWNRFTAMDNGIQVIEDDRGDGERIRFQSHMLVCGNILDLDR